MRKLTHKCPLCPKWTLNALDLRTHLWTKHDVSAVAISGSGTRVEVITERGKALSAFEPRVRVGPRLSRIDRRYRTV